MTVDLAAHRSETRRKQRTISEPSNARPMSDRELDAALLDGVTVALRTLGVRVTPDGGKGAITTDERAALVSALALRVLRNAGERLPDGRTIVRVGAANRSYLVTIARALAVQSREWRDCAESYRTPAERRGDDAPRVTACDPSALDDPTGENDDVQGALAVAVMRRAQAQTRKGEGVDPGQALGALDALTDALRGQAWESDAQRVRVRLALAVALDERAPDVALVVHGCKAHGWTLRTAQERNREGAAMVRKALPAWELADALRAAVDGAVDGAAMGEEGGSLPRGLGAAAAAVEAAIASVGGRVGCKDHAAPLTPRERDYAPWTPLAVDGAPGTLGQALTRYLLAVDRKLDKRAAHDDRIGRLTARAD